MSAHCHDDVVSWKLRGKHALVEGDPVFALTPHKDLSDANDTGKVIVIDEPWEVRR